MRGLWVLVAVAGLGVGVSAETGAGIPWEEFKTLYREHIERELSGVVMTPTKVPIVYSFDSARYRISVGGDFARGEAILSGRVVSGDPAAIPIFGPEAVLTEIADVTGGAMVHIDGCMAFFPEFGSQTFSLRVSFLVRTEDSDGGSTIAFGVPPALQNSLVLEAPDGAIVLDSPGIMDGEGVRHFHAIDRLTIRFRDQQQAGELEPIELDGLARIAVQRSRVSLTSYFAAARPASVPVVLIAPPNAKLISHSLRANRLKPLGGDRYEIELPVGDSSEFWMEFSLELGPEQTEITVPLPRIEDNSGRQGNFVLEEPDDGQITVNAAGLIPQIPLERLGTQLAARAEGQLSFMRVNDGEPITLTVHWFQAMRAASIVLECQSLYTAFEENGNVLSILTLDVPPDAGSRLSLKAVPDSEIWSLRVNESKREVFMGEEGVWLVPLDKGQQSHVELAFLRKGTKLGLHGKLDVVVPETGFASRDLRVAIALPPRVDLLFAEGPVNPASGEGWQAPPEFVGKPYYFSRSFYKGEGLNVSLSYKEPVEVARQVQGVHQ